MFIPHLGVIWTQWYPPWELNYLWASEITKNYFSIYDFCFSSRNTEKLSQIFTYFVCAGFITVWHSLSLLHRQMQLLHCRKYRSADWYSFVWLWVFALILFWHMISEKKIRNALHTHANKNGLSYPVSSRSKIKDLFFWDELWIRWKQVYGICWTAEIYIFFSLH